MVYDLNQRVLALERGWQNHREQMVEETAERKRDVGIIENRLDFEMKKVDAAVASYQDGTAEGDSRGPRQNDTPMITRRGFEAVQPLTGEIDGFADWLF